MRLVSGGQTGVDRGALDAAIACGVAHGGWCPAGRLAEDGTVPATYSLQEAPRPGYYERTLRNVVDSDATLLLYHGDLSGGTEETLRVCLQLRRPYRLIDAREVSAARAGELAAEFVVQRGVGTLNVAGPRASGWLGGEAYAYEAITTLCRAIQGQSGGVVGTS